GMLGQQMSGAGSDAELANRLIIKRLNHQILMGSGAVEAQPTIVISRQEHLAPLFTLNETDGTALLLCKAANLSQLGSPLPSYHEPLAEVALTVTDDEGDTAHEQTGGGNRATGAFHHGVTGQQTAVLAQ